MVNKPTLVFVQSLLNDDRLDKLTVKQLRHVIEHFQDANEEEPETAEDMTFEEMNRMVL